MIYYTYNHTIISNAIYAAEIYLAEFVLLCHLEDI